MGNLCGGGPSKSEQERKQIAENLSDQRKIAALEQHKEAQDEAKARREAEEELQRDKQKMIDQRRLAHEEDCNELNDKWYNEHLEIITKEVISEFIKEEEDQMEQILQLLAKKVGDELIDKQTEQFAVQFDKAEKEKKFRDFTKQFDYIRDEEKQLQKTLYEDIGSPQLFTTEVNAMRDLNSDQVVDLLTQDSHVKTLIDQKHLKEKGGLSGEQLLQFDVNMVETHLNVTDEADKILILKYVEQHNPIVRQVFKTGDQDPYVITPEQTQDLPTNILILRFIQNAIYFSSKYRENAAKQIQARLESEKIIQKTKLTEKCKEALDTASNLEEYQDTLKGLLRAYQPFDIELFKQMIVESTKNSEKVKGKNPMLILGGTGAGKSTTIQWLCGSKMHKTTAQTPGGTVEYIDVEEYDNSVCATEDLKDVKIGPTATSCTSFIKVLTINNKDSEIVIVDTPGLMDSRGCEVDTANILGIVKASFECESILPVLVLSDNIGDRGQILKGYAWELSKMFRNIDEAADSIKFLFTKLPNTSASQKKLKMNFNEIFKHLNEDEKSDKNFMTLFTTLIEAVRTERRIRIVDPLQKLDSKMLRDLDKMAHLDPAHEVFNMTVSDLTKQVLEEQIDMHNHIIEHVGLKQGNYKVIKDKLDDFKFLREKLKDVGFITESYKKAVRELKNYIQQKFEKSKLDFEECLTQSTNVLTTSILEQALSNITTIKSLIGILKPTHSEIMEEIEDDNNQLDQPETFITILVQTTKQLQTKITENKFPDLLATPEYLKNLQSLRNIRDVFSDEESIVEMVNKTFTSVKDQCIELVNCTNQAIEDVDAEKVCENTLTIKDIQANLVDFELGFDDGIVNDLKQKLFTRIEKETFKGAQTSFNLVKDREYIQSDELNQIFTDIQSSLEVLSKAASSVTVQKLYADNQFKDLYEQLKKFIDEKYAEKMDSISEFVFAANPQEYEEDDNENEQEQEEDIKIVQSLLPGMNMCQQIDSKLYQVLSANNRSRFILLVQEISNKVTKIIKEIKSKFEFCMDIKSPEQAYQMVEGLDNLRRLKWFDQFQQTSQIEIAIEDTESDIQQYITSFSEQASESYHNHNFEKLSTCLLKLIQLTGTEFKQQINKVKEMYTARFKEFTEELDSFSDSMNGGANGIPQQECERKLIFFTNFKHFDQKALNVVQQVNDSEKKFMAVLKSSCQSYYSVSIDAGSIFDVKDEDIQFEMDKLFDLKVLEKKSPSLYEKLKPLELMKQMVEQLEALVESCRQSKDKLKKLAKRDQQEELFDKMDKFRVLDTFITGNNNFKMVRKELSDDIFEAGQGKYKELIENLEDDDFAQARYSFDTLDSEEVIKGKSRIEKRINFIVGELDRQSARVTLHNDIEFYYKCSSLSKKVKDVEDNFGPSPGEETNARAVEPIIIRKLVESKKHLSSCISVKIDRKLDKVLEQMGDNEFREVIDYLDFLLDNVRGIITDLLSVEVAEKAEKMNTEFMDLVKEQCKQYEKRPPKHFQTYPLRALIVKLEGVRNIEMKTLVFNLKEKVKKNFVDHLEVLKVQQLDLKNGLNNKEFVTIKLALKFLPDDIAGEIQDVIEEFKENYEKLKSDFVKEIKENIIEHQVGAIYDKIALLKKAGRFDDLAKTEQAISAQIQTIVEEYKNLITAGEIDAIISKLQNILSYEGKFDSIVSVGSAINEAQKLTVDQLEKCRETIEHFIKDAGLTDFTPIPQQRYTKVTYQIEFFYSMKKSFTNSQINFNFEELHETIVASVEKRERRNRIQITQALDPLSMAKAINILLKEDNMIGITNVLLQQSQVKLTTQTTAEDVKTWLKTKVNELIVSLTEPFANKQLFENYSYQKDKRQSQIIKHYSIVFANSQLLKSLPLIKSRIESVQYDGNTVEIDKIDGIFHDKLKVAVNKECDNIVNKIKKNHFTEDGKFTSQTPKETAFCIDNLIEFQKIFKDDQASEVQVADEGEDQQIVSNSTSRFAYTTDLWNKIEKSVNELDIMFLNDYIKSNNKKRDIKMIVDDLIILKKLFDNLLHFQTQFGEQTEKIILESTQKSQDNKSRRFTCEIKDLMGGLEKESESCTFAASLLRDHPIFITERNAQIRKLYEHGTIDQMIRGFEANANNENIDTDKLKEAYETYLLKLGQFDTNFNKYSGILQAIRKPDPIKFLIDDLKKTKTGMKRWGADTRHQNIPVIVAYMVAIIALHRAKGVIKSSTEEDIGTKNCLFLANTNQIMGIFRLLAIGFRDSRERISGSLLQVPSGEGKSYLIAVTMAVLSFLNNDVTCLCQNKYLKKRNEDDFTFLFKLLDGAGFTYSKHVRYESVASFKQKMIEQSKDFTKNLEMTLSGDNSYFAKKADENIPKILLFDEVDQIFKEKYQEARFSFSCKVTDDEWNNNRFLKLLKEMYKYAGLSSIDIRAAIGNFFSGKKHDYLKLAELKQTKEYKECTGNHNSPFKDYKELFDVQLQNVIYDVLKYTLETKEDYILAYQDHTRTGTRVALQSDKEMTVQEILDTKRYQVQLKILELMETGQFGRVAEKYIQMPIECGELLIQKEIKKNFGIFMGVTSCLEDTVITDYEKSLLKTEFKMESLTTVPSLFADKALDFVPDQHLVIPPDMEFMRDLATEVVSGLKGETGQRCVVLFIEDGPALQEMAKHQMFDEDQFKDNIQILTNWKHVMHIPESLNNYQPTDEILNGSEWEGNPDDIGNFWCIKFANLKYTELVVKSVDNQYYKTYTRKELKRNSYTDEILADKTQIGLKGGVDVYIKQVDKVSQLEYSNAVKISTMPGKVTFMMKELLVGTNFDVTSPEVLQNGGLHVIYVGWPDSLMEESQAQKRHIQHGRGGSFKYVINEKDLMEYLSLQQEELGDKDDVYEQLREKIKEDQETNFNAIKGRAIKLEQKSEETSTMMKLVNEKSSNKHVVQSTLIKFNPGDNSDQLYSQFKVGFDANQKAAQEAQKREQERQAQIQRDQEEAKQQQLKQQEEKRIEIEKEYDTECQKLEDHALTVEKQRDESKAESEQANQDHDSAQKKHQETEASFTQAKTSYNEFYDKEYLPKKNAFDEQQQKYLDLKNAAMQLKQNGPTVTTVVYCGEKHEMEEQKGLPSDYDDGVSCDECKKELDEAEMANGFMHCGKCDGGFDYCKACTVGKTEEKVEQQDAGNGELEKAQAAAEKEKEPMEQLYKEVEELKKQVEELQEKQDELEKQVEAESKILRELAKEKDKLSLAAHSAESSLTNTKTKMVQEKRRLKNAQTQALKESAKRSTTSGNRR